MQGGVEALPAAAGATTAAAVAAAVADAKAATTAIATVPAGQAGWPGPQKSTTSATTTSPTTDVAPAAPLARTLGPPVAPSSVGQCRRRGAVSPRARPPAQTARVTRHGGGERERWGIQRQQPTKRCAREQRLGCRLWHDQRLVGDRVAAAAAAASTATAAATAATVRGAGRGAALGGNDAGILRKRRIALLLHRQDGRCIAKENVVLHITVPHASSGLVLHRNKQGWGNKANTSSGKTATRGLGPNRCDQTHGTG